LLLLLVLLLLKLSNMARSDSNLWLYAPAAEERRWRSRLLMRSRGGVDLVVDR